MKMTAKQKSAASASSKIQRQVELAVVKELTKRGRTLNWTPKSVYRTRHDIKSWQQSLQLAQNADNPVNWALQNLFDEIRIDALLTSQIENRKQQVFSAGFSLKKENGDIDEETTRKLKKSAAYRLLMDAVLDIRYVGYNLVELDLTDKKDLTVTLVPRTNVTPQNGRFYSDFMSDKYENYRELPDYGKWILEFDSGSLGLLNKAVPHVLFKRFAQSCYSELCEIYGIPPRVLKTNTQDPAMLNRGEAMMRDMGAAAWFIIDETESFEFAKGTETNGDVYSNLIRLCNNENTLLVSGAVIGQDTVNGNRSKDESAQNMLWELVKSDMEMAEQYWNDTIIPALVRIGFLPDGLTFEFDPSEDIDQLFKFTIGLLPFKQIDDNWLEEKFGVKVTGDKSASDTALNLSAFFD
jgi:hypothetical protein